MAYQLYSKVKVRIHLNEECHWRSNRHKIHSPVPTLFYPDGFLAVAYASNRKKKQFCSWYSFYQTPEADNWVENWLRHFICVLLSWTIQYYYYVSVNNIYGRQNEFYYMKSSMEFWLETVNAAEATASFKCFRRKLNAYHSTVIRPLSNILCSIWSPIWGFREMVSI